MEFRLDILAIMLAILFFLKYITREPYLDFRGRFKPKRHFFFERCSKCGKKLKHYHWFWGKGDFMACDVDYDGNTEWLCEKCNNKQIKNCVYKEPHL